MSKSKDLREAALAYKKQEIHMKKRHYAIKHRIKAFLRINVSLNNSIHYVLRYP